MFKFLKQKNRKNTGFTLVEVLVALFIFSLTVTAMMAVFASGLSSINVAKKKMVAEYLAQEGIELVRNIRDTYALSETTSGAGWTSFLNELGNSDCDEICSFNDTLISSSTIGILNSGAITSAGFTRYVRKVEMSANEVKIFSTVSWNNGAKTVTFSENLFNWIETE